MSSVSPRSSVGWVPGLTAGGGFVPGGRSAGAAPRPGVPARSGGGSSSSGSCASTPPQVLGASRSSAGSSSPSGSRGDHSAPWRLGLACPRASARNRSKSGWVGHGVSLDDVAQPKAKTAAPAMSRLTPDRRLKGLAMLAATNGALIDLRSATARAPSKPPRRVSVIFAPMPRRAGSADRLSASERDPIRTWLNARTKAN